MAATSSNGPAPSRHIFIHQVLDQEQNAKVRFLGCVIDYDDRTGRLTVKHDYPRVASSRPPTEATVDINMVLESTNMELLQPGSWINVIGYVRSLPMSKGRRPSTSRRKTVAELPEIQAVLVWSAGAVQVEKYEKTMEEHLESMVTRR
jgi:hypothetical protein